MTVHFKLSKPSGLTRRITFVTRPSWPVLSARIANLYDIAIGNIGVSYIDSDGDEVTLSSDDELQEFYASAVLPEDGAIKLTVHDLGSLRTVVTTPTASFSSATPQQSHFRNTFGGHEMFPLVFEADGEWQRLPGNLGSLFLSRDAPESPHAFVEVLESDVSVSKSDTAESDATHSNLTFTPVNNKDKGKGRAATVEDDVSSADSVIGDEAPTKPPVHVFDVHSEGMFGLPPVQPSQSGVATPAQAQSTPVISEQTLKVHESGAEEQRAEVTVDDPPLPSLDLPNPDQVSPSLVHDVAAFLTTISTVLSTHPELSDSFRNIIANTTNGTYWTAHRNAISRAAENFHRTTMQETGRSIDELRRTAEQEASSRVSEAVGTIFRTVGGFVQDSRENTGPQDAGNDADISHDEATVPLPRSPSGAPGRSGFPHLPPHPRRNHHLWFTPPPFTHPGPPWTHPPSLPPPPPPPPPPPLPPRNWPRPPPPRFWDRDIERTEPFTGGQGARAAFTDVLAAATEARVRATEQRARNISSQPSSTSEITPEELRAEVERAKADYRVRKERYRQAKAIKKMAEQRRQDRESTSESLSRQTSDNPVQVVPADDAGCTEPQAEGPSAAASDVHIVSNARGRYPQLEMFSVPKRGHTMSHMHRGHVQENRPLNRIMRKLSDMGFSEGTYPNLTKKVMDQLLLHPPSGKDAEDDIVTNLIEELIPSGGGMHTGGIPGAWH